MTNLRDLAIVCSARLGLPYLFRAAPGQGLNTILFHQFRFGDESWTTARERLRRQLDFLVSSFDAVNMETAMQILDGASRSIRAPLLITLDDAKRDILEVFDIFQAFGVPLTQFVCSGWTARAKPDAGVASLRSSIVSWLHFYDGPEEVIRIGGRSFSLNHLGNAQLIDEVIATEQETLLAALAEREAETRRDRSKSSICTWSELRDLQQQGITVGCHSVSHPRLAQQSPQRQEFEIVASRELIESHLGYCPYFAYPYGTPDSHSPQTYRLLKENGFLAAFTTWPDVAKRGYDKLLLPRIALPDTDMSDAMFQARACGGGIPLSKLKHKLS